MNIYPDAGNGRQIRTYTGRLVDPTALTVDDVHYMDIGHALAHQCRYGGHAGGFYSVAQHSVLVARRLRWQHCNARAQMAGLMHDASEAYVVDVPAPLKANLPEYRTIEERVHKVVAEKFDYWYPHPEGVALADKWVYELECVTYRLEGGWPPQEAKSQFLGLFFDLQIEMGRHVARADQF